VIFELAPATMSLSQLESMRILVVEDELLLRWSIVETLTQAGCSVTDVGDAASALRAAAAQDFDVVILDYLLPDSRDLTLLETLRGRFPNSRVVMMSAFRTPETSQRAHALGVHAFLDKPFEMEALKHLLANQVRRS
jgi:DNA-binding NtrC family response regulator